MSLMRAFKLRAFRFGRDTNGAMPVEGAMASIFLVWWYIASLQFFDAYRQKNVNQKAAYTVADMLSRETGSIPGDANSTVINEDYMHGLNVVFDYLSFSKRPTWLRITSVYWDEADDRYEVAWSVTTGGHEGALNDAKLALVKNRIPDIPTGDTIVITETFMAYEPMFNLNMPSFGPAPDIKLNARWDNTFITTRPRFASCIPWKDQGCGDDGTGAPGGVDSETPIIEPDDPPDIP